jgi:hypothetical protein
MRKYLRRVTPAIVSAKTGLPVHLASDEINAHVGAGFRSPVPWLFLPLAIALYFVATGYLGIAHFWVREGSGSGLLLGLVSFAAGGAFATARSIAYERIISSARARQQRIAGHT